MLFQYEVFVWNLSVIVIYHAFVSEDKKKLIALCHRRRLPSEGMDKNLRCFERRIISCYGGQRSLEKAIYVGLSPRFNLRWRETDFFDELEF